MAEATFMSQLPTNKGLSCLPLYQKLLRNKTKDLQPFHCFISQFPFTRSPTLRDLAFASSTILLRSLGVKEANGETISAVADDK